MVAMIVLGVIYATTPAKIQLFIGFGLLVFFIDLAWLYDINIKRILRNKRMLDGDNTQDRINIDKLSAKASFIKMIMLICCVIAVSSVPIIALTVKNVAVMVVSLCLTMIAIVVIVLYSFFIGTTKIITCREVLIMITKGGVHQHKAIAKRMGLSVAQVESHVRKLEKMRFIKPSDTTIAIKPTKDAPVPKYCGKCGQPTKDGKNFCTNCGKEVY